MSYRVMVEEPVGLRVMDSCFDHYGDAQRRAWQLLRAKGCTLASIAVLKSDGEWGIMEYWCIGQSGKYRLESDSEYAARTGDGLHSAWSPT